MMMYNSQTKYYWVGILGFLCIPIFYSNNYAQGIGVNKTGSNPDASAIFDASSTNKGQLLPRMTTDQRNAIVNPANGLLIYNLDCNSFNYFNGTSWVSMNGTSSLGDPGAISGSTSVCSGTTGETYSISAVTGATSYSWTVPTGATITAGQGTTSITVTFGSASGDVCVTANDECFTSDISCTTVTVSGSGISLSELKAYYKFNEASGNIINQAGAVGSTESIGSSVDIQITGATYSQSGIIGNALSFDGVNDYGELGTSLSDFNFLHGPDEDMSVNIWVKFIAWGNERRFLSNLDPTEQNGHDFGTSATTTQMYESEHTSSGFLINLGAETGVTLNNTDWFLFTYTLDYDAVDKNYKWYINGNLVRETNRGNTGVVGNAEHNMILAARATTTSNFLNAKIDELSIWNRELSSCEIEYLYNSGNGRDL